MKQWLKRLTTGHMDMSGRLRVHFISCVNHTTDLIAIILLLPPQLRSEYISLDQEGVGLILFDMKREWLGRTRTHPPLHATS